MEREICCCFTGHRPNKLSWGDNEGDARCVALKQSIRREVEALYHRGLRHFVTGMALGCDLYFAEAVLNAREVLPGMTLECALPYRAQAARWCPEDQRRHRGILERCDMETLVQEHYDRFCMFRRDRYMVERASTILAVYDGTPGGTRYTLNYAMSKKLRVLLLDLNHPENRATELYYSAS